MFSSTTLINLSFCVFSTVLAASFNLCAQSSVAQFSGSLEANLSSRSYFLPSSASGKVHKIAQPDFLAVPNGHPVFILKSDEVETSIRALVHEIGEIEYALKEFGFYNERDRVQSAYIRRHYKKIFPYIGTFESKPKIRETVIANVTIPSDTIKLILKALKITRHTKLDELLKLWRDIRDQDSQSAKLLMNRVASALPKTLRNEEQLGAWVFQLIRETTHRTLADRCAVDDQGLGRRKMHLCNPILLNQTNQIRIPLPLENPGFLIKRFRYYWETVSKEALFTEENVAFIDQVHKGYSEYSVRDVIAEILSECDEVEAHVEMVKACQHGLFFVADVLVNGFNPVDRLSFNWWNFDRDKAEVAIRDKAFEYWKQYLENHEGIEKALREKFRLHINTNAKDEANRLMILVAALAPPKPDEFLPPLNTYTGFNRKGLFLRLVGETTQSLITHSGDRLVFQQANRRYPRHLQWGGNARIISPFPISFGIGIKNQAPVAVVNNRYGYPLPSLQAVDKNKSLSLLANIEHAAALEFSGMIRNKNNPNYWEEILTAHASTLMTLETQLKTAVMSLRQNKKTLYTDLKNLVDRYNWGAMHVGAPAVVRRTLVGIDEAVKQDDVVLVVESTKTRALAVNIPESQKSQWSSVVKLAVSLKLKINFSPQVIPLSKAQQKIVKEHSEQIKLITSLREVTRLAAEHVYDVRDFRFDPKLNILHAALDVPTELVIKPSDLKHITFEKLCSHLGILGLSFSSSDDMLKLSLPLGLLPYSEKVVVALETTNKTIIERNEWSRLLNQ